MQMKPKDKLETWLQGFWYAMWGTWAVLLLVNLGFFFPFLMFLGPAHLATWCFLRFRRWKAGRDD